MGRVNSRINTRPGWVNITPDRMNVIQNRWRGAVAGYGGRQGISRWDQRHPERMRYWNRWGDRIRRNWWYGRYQPGWFGPRWWEHHHHPVAGWHYWHRFGYHDWDYWWSAPTWGGLTAWFSWTNVPAGIWTEPVYYDYGPGGNVYYENNVVYVHGEQVATAPEFAESAAALATVPPPPSPEIVADLEWQPLGTFALSTSAYEIEPSRVLQLAVTKEGIIGGTMFNTETDEAQTIQGQVDKETQRVAFRIGESDDVVFETGLYNLTQDEAPILIHFGTQRVENGVLVRLQYEGDGEEAVSWRDDD